MNTHEFSFDSFKSDGEKFIKTLTETLIEAGLPTASLLCDHVCFRVGTSSEYDFYKNALLSHGTLLTEAIVNGRAISTFRLNSAFQTDSHEVPLIEIPAPKEGTHYSTGFEHVEFVVNECFSVFRLRYPQLDFNVCGNQTLNPELCLRVGQGIQVKFHYLSLDRVIELEEAKIKDIIFDFDGTLIKSRESIYEINRVVFSNALGREVSLEESIEKFHPEFSKLLDAFAVSCPIRRAEAVSSWSKVSSQFSYELFDGVLEALNELKGLGFRLHLWTARDEQSTRKILNDHGLTGLFTTLSFATEIDSKPLANNLCFEWKRAIPNQVIVVGDSPSDVLGAKNISAIRGAALWDPHSNRSSLVASGAELFFYKVADFKDWVVNSVREVPDDLS